MPDQYANFESLAADKQEGVEYRIAISPQRSNVCVISPHGGGIEPGVTELVRAVACDQFSWYLFEGTQRTNNLEELHITSHNFREPRGVAFVSTHRFALALHGYRGRTPKTYLGGKNRAAGELIAHYMRGKGFEFPSRSLTPPHVLGEDPNNFCNLCSDESGGVQLEITEEQRSAFFDGDLHKRADRKKTTAVFAEYVATIQRALGEIDSWF